MYNGGLLRTNKTAGASELLSFFLGLFLLFLGSKARESGNIGSPLGTFGRYVPRAPGFRAGS